MIEARFVGGVLDGQIHAYPQPMLAIRVPRLDSVHSDAEELVYVPRDWEPPWVYELQPDDLKELIDD